MADGPPSAWTQLLRRAVEDLLAQYPPQDVDRVTFLRGRFDAGLAWIHRPVSLGGMDAPRELQPTVDRLLAARGAPGNRPERNIVGHGMAAPTIFQHGTDTQRRRWLRPLWTGEEIWCQLFSEPGAGSDLAAVRTRADQDGSRWVVNGQKVWTSLAHEARWGILLARTDPGVRKHAGLTYFVVDMLDAGVEVRPLRQITGEAEFNEVFLTDVSVPDEQRIGAVGDGWRVAMTTLANERSVGGSQHLPREGGAIGRATGTWRKRPELRTNGQHVELLRLWVEAEANRLMLLRLGQLRASGQPGPESSAGKLATSEANQRIAGFTLELLSEEGLRYDEGFAMRRPDVMGGDYLTRSPGYTYLRSRANTIEGGTSEILRNIIAERVLGLPAEPRLDKDVPWKDLPK